MVVDECSKSFVNQSSFFDKVIMMDQPQSLVTPDGDQLPYLSSSDNQSCVQRIQSSSEQAANQSQSIRCDENLKFENFEQFISMMRSNFAHEQKIMINGKTFELQQAPKLEEKHQFTHQVSSINSNNTAVSMSCQLEEQKRSEVQVQKDVFSDKKVVETQNSKQFQGFSFANFDMGKINTLKLDRDDDLLIINDLDDDRLDPFTPLPKKKQSLITPTPQCDRNSEKKVSWPILDNQPLVNTKSKEQLSEQSTKTLEQMPCVQSECQLQLKRHMSEQPIMSQFIVSQSLGKFQNSHTSSNQLQTQMQVISQLTKQLQDKSQEVCSLKDQLQSISTSLAKIYKKPELLSQNIDDQELLSLIQKSLIGNQKLHLAFMFSSPLIVKYVDENNGDVRVQTIQQIDYNKELSGVIESFKDTGNYIRYRKIPATLDNLRKTLTENPIALHFSGHGIENNQKNFGKDSIKLRDQGNFLIFEDQEGCAQFMSEKKLHELLEASGNKLEFVFVASCYSQFAGEIFHNAGARHVICVRKGFQISDEASIIFSKNFYHALFSQTVTVCQAFDIAKAALRAEKDKKLAEESKKFVLLKDTDECEKLISQTQTLVPYCGSSLIPKKHKCHVFGPLIKGKVENAGIEAMFKLETSKVEDFVGRSKEMQEIIADILYNRFVTIKGMPGIGKTTIAKAIIHYLDERQIFKDGIIMLSLRGLDQANMILTRLQLIISQHLQKEPKEDKAIESFHQIQERIFNFFKDKDILICLDNAEDTMRKESTQFRDILQNLLVNCPRIKMLLTSRNPIGHFADISEKIYVVKELVPHYAIELLMKKAMRPILDAEIQDLLQNSKPQRVLHSNPVGPKKNIKRLDEHHLSALLGGHPHAISLAAPLLQDKSLKELYSLLNSPDIIKWLQIQGIEGNPIASLKVSLDTSIEHMTEQEPQAIKLFCLIGLFPGGCTVEDLNCLWRDGWTMLAEKLLRSSLLVKKNGSNNEIRYTLFPFMNQYAVQLMDEDSKTREHKNICYYLAQICKGLLKLSQQEIINRLVSFETNIWACIYRIMDHYQTPGGDSIRGKSPAPYMRDSQNLLRSQQFFMNKSGDDSSHDGSNSDERYNDPSDEYYESILYQRRNDRSLSERMSTKRSLANNNDYADENDNFEEEESKEQCSEQSLLDSSSKQRIDTDQSQYETKTKDELQSILKKKQSYTQPQSLAHSHIMDQKDCQDSAQSDQDQDLQRYLADEQISMLITSSQQYEKAKKSLKSHNNQRIQSADDLEQHVISYELDNTESVGLNRTSSNECQTPSSNQPNSNSFGSKQKNPQEINDIKLMTLPFNKNHILKNFVGHQIDDDAQSMIQFNNDFIETSSIDSLQHQLMNISQNSCSDMSIMNQTRRKSAYSTAKFNKLQEIDETFDENDSCIMMEDENTNSNKIQSHQDTNQNDTQKSIEEGQLSPLAQMSKANIKSNQNLLSVLQLQDANDNVSGQSEQNLPKPKKQNNKRVTILDNATTQSNSLDTKKSALAFNTHQCQYHSAQQNSLMALTHDGSLIIFYITNLVISNQYEEALKTIENFGLKVINDQLCIANLRKLQAYILSQTTQDYKSIQIKYEESLKIFTHLKIYHGQALCYCAIGLLMYSNPNGFMTKKTNENQIFDKAMKRFEEAASLYNKSNHYVGEAFCNKMLGFIKKKLGENFIDNQRKQKALMLKDNNLQQEGKASFMHLYGGRVEISLFLEIIQQEINSHQPNRETLYSLKNQRIKEAAECNCTSSVRSKKDVQIKIEKFDELKQTSNISTQKKGALAAQSIKDAKSKTSSKPSINVFNKEFDMLKMSLDIAKKPEVAIEIQDNRDTNMNSEKSRLQNSDKNKKREPPKTSKTYPIQAQNFAKTQFKHLEISKVEDIAQSNLFISSDGEQFGLGLSNQIPNKVAIKEEKKKTHDLQANAIKQIQSYRNKRTEQMEKAKNSQLSASFIQPKNQLGESQKQGKPLNQDSQQPYNYQTLNQSLRKTLNKKKGAELLDGNKITKESRQQNQDLLFEPANDIDSPRIGSDDDEVESLFERSSLLAPSHQNQSKTQQKSLQPSMIPQGRNSGRLSGRPSLGHSSQDKQQEVIRRQTMGSTSQGKKEKPSKLSEPLANSQISRAYQQNPNNSRLASPNQLSKRQSVLLQPQPLIQQQQQTPTSVQQTTTTTTNVGGNQFMQLNITTTTTVKIEMPPQGQPQIIVEAVDEPKAQA